MLKYGGCDSGNPAEALAVWAEIRPDPLLLRLVLLAGTLACTDSKRSRTN